MNDRVATGRFVARVLQGAWRPHPPAQTITADLLRAVNPLLISNGAGALVWRRLGAADEAIRRSDEGFELQQAYWLHSVQSLQHAELIARAVQRLRSEHIEPLLSKGWAAARLYPEPGLRPYADIDLHVRADQIESARRALFLRDGEPLPVDLHEGAGYLRDRSWEEIEAHAQRVLIGGTWVRIPGPEDHLHLLCAHALAHGIGRPLALCDIGAALESRPADFDWNYFLGADETRSRWLHASVALAHHILGASISGTPLAEHHFSLPHWAARTVYKQWARPATGWRRHWPNAIQATFGLEKAPGAMPPLPLQLAHRLSRASGAPTR